MLRLNYLLQLLLLLRPLGLLLLLGLQRLGDLGDGDEAVRLAEHQRVAGLEQLHPRDVRGVVMPVLLLPCRCCWEWDRSFSPARHAGEAAQTPRHAGARPGVPPHRRRRGHQGIAGQGGGEDPEGAAAAAAAGSSDEARRREDGLR